MNCFNLYATLIIICIVIICIEITTTTKGLKINMKQRYKFHPVISIPKVFEETRWPNVLIDSTWLMVYLFTPVWWLLHPSHFQSPSPHGGHSFLWLFSTVIFRIILKKRMQSECWLIHPTSSQPHPADTYTCLRYIILKQTLMISFGPFVDFEVFNPSPDKQLICHDKPSPSHHFQCNLM